MKVFVLILMIWLLISCNKSVKENITNESLQDLSNSISITNIELIEKKLEQIEQIQDIDYLIIKEDSVEIPFFEIKIELSETAEEELMNNNESVIVIAYFTTILDDIGKIPEKYDDRLVMNNDLNILTHSIEITDERLVRFEKLEFPKDLYDLLDYKDIHVLVNIVSGRRSSNFNLIHCAILSGPISKVKEQKFTLNGGLIGEKIETNSISLR